MKSAALILVLALSTCVPAFAGDDDTSKLPPATTDRAYVPPSEKDVSRLQINGLVEQLADGDPAVQQKAHAGLVELLADAMPRLELLLRESKDEPTRGRAKAVLDDIRKRARFAPAVITLHASDRPVALLAEIFRQAHLPMTTGPLNLADDASTPAVNVNFDRRPFWAAAKEVCEASHLDVRYVYDDQRLTVARGEGALLHGPSSVFGPAIVFAENAGQATKIGDEKRTGLLRLIVCVEPRVRVLGLTTDITTLADENGDPLLPPGVDQRGRGSLYETDYQWQSQIPIAPTRFSRRAAKFAGTMHLTIQTGAKTLEMPLKPGMPAVHKEFGGYAIDFRGFDSAGDGYVLKMGFVRGALADWQWKWIREPMRRVHVFDENGVPLRVSGSGQNWDDKAGQSTINFVSSDGSVMPASGKPAKLVWELPTAAEQVDVPFELIDIDLPIVNPDAAN